MAVTVSELLAVQTGVLTSAADDLSRRASRLAGAAEELATVKDRMDWEGEGAEGAIGAFVRIVKELEIDQHDIKARSQVLEDAATTLWNLQTQLAQELSQAESLAMTVSDNGVVTPLPIFGDVLESVRHGMLPLIQAEIQRILWDATRIDSRLAEVLNEQQSGGLSAINLGGFSSGAPTEDEARFLAESLTDGDISDYDLELLLSQLQRAGVTSDQMPQGAAFGDEVVLPAGSLDYLQELYESIPPHEWLKLQTKLQNGSTDGIRALGDLHNGWLAVSSDKVTDASGAIGGVKRLPDFAQQMLSGKPISDTGGIPDGLLANPVWDRAINDPTSMERVALNNAYFGQISGVPQPGNALTKDLLRVQSAGASLSTDVVRYEERADQFNQMITTLTGADLPYGETDSLRITADNVGVDLQKLINRNPQAIADMLTGPPSQVSEVFRPLLLQEWGDDGSAIGETLSWMGEGMLGDNPNLQVSKEDSSRAAFGLATLLTDTSVTDQLLDAGGANGLENVGQLNPHLLRGALEGLTPALPSMFGYGQPDRVWFDQNEQGVWMSKFDKSDASERLGNLSILMHTDNDTATSFRSHLGTIQDGLIQQGIGGISNAGEISGIVAFGEDAVEIESSNDAGQLNQQEFDSRKADIDLGKDILSEVIGKLPPGWDFAGKQALERGTNAFAGEDPQWVNQVLSGGSRPLTFEELGNLKVFKQSIHEKPLTPEEVSPYFSPEALRPDGSIDFEAAGISENEFATFIQDVLEQRGQTNLADEFSDRSIATYDSQAQTFNDSGRG